MAELDESLIALGMIETKGIVGAIEAADAMIDAMLSATSREAFVSAVRALDRVLISGDYVVPLFHAPGTWIAHWRRVAGPPTSPLLGESFDTWWASGPK